jgi:hypothetical protein
LWTEVIKTAARKWYCRDFRARSDDSGQCSHGMDVEGPAAMNRAA